MVHSNILRCTFEYVSNSSQFFSKKNESFKPKLLQFQETFSIFAQQCVFQERFLNNFDSCLKYKSVSYTMVYTPCFEEVYLDIRNRSGCLCVMSFLKAGLYCIPEKIISTHDRPHFFHFIFHFDHI